MEFDETMVDVDNAVEDDTLPEGIVEESEDEPEEEVEYSDEYTEESEEAPDEEQPEPEQDDTPPQSEPGWIKKRVQKAVDKAVAEALAQQQEQFNQQIAPLIAKMQEDEAQELVRSRKIADIETAREFVRLKNGNTPPPTPAPQPRNEQGQFASREQIETETRINELKKQADKIKSKGGPDVIKEFTENEDIKRRVVNGELDFYDVADIMRSKKKKPPTPTRSPNGSAKYSPNAFDSMSKEQFERFEKQIDRGVRYSMK